MPTAKRGMAALANRMTENDLMEQIRSIVKGFSGKILMYHTRDSRGSYAGWPDLVFVRNPQDGCPSPPPLFRELKRQGGKTTAAQDAWLGALQAAGMDAGVWYPDDLINQVIADELVKLAGVRQRPLVIQELPASNVYRADKTDRFEQYRNLFSK